uniref:Geranylgeranyl diphosphate synthase n=4 Tax=Ditylum brightwellii TaxID=49249 RepID=A0A7S4QMV0_9STRA|mmetsp:Transcript_27507/g.36529  ORF Transcript_27507/g.36529 Transcript_27507/m.36529 type:complete len:346 (-) Transcript_27507:152-1189(-)
MADDNFEKTKSPSSSESSPSDQMQTSEFTPHETDPALLESYRYIANMPGKNVRGKLIDCFQLWLNVDSESVLTEIKEIISDLHNASLMIDDIEDNSKLRRGVPVAHSIFGVAPVINTANYMFFLGLERCHALNNPKAMRVFVLEILNLHRGQGHDIMWRDNVQCPTEEDYCKMVIDKTGGLFRLAVGLMQACATQNITTDFSPLVNNLGLYFQIRDDLINLVDEDYFKAKTFCEDLTEGKFSFPIVHCVTLNMDEAGTRLLSILRQRTDDVDVKLYAQSLMKQSGSLRYTWEKCVGLKDEIVEQIESLGGNAPLLKLVEYLHATITGLEGAVSGTSTEPQQPPQP